MKFDLAVNEMYKGKCLVAMPDMQNALFSRSVIYISEHNTIAGAVGVMINKDIDYVDDLDISADELLDYNSDWHSVPMYLGGPVEASCGFMLYAREYNPELFLAGRSKMAELGLHEDIKPYMIATGYCMWETLQLEKEVKMSNWLVLDNVAIDLLTHVEPEDRYLVALKIAGIPNLAAFDYRGRGNA